MGFILGDVLLRTVSQSPAPTDNSRFACSEKRTTGRVLARKSQKRSSVPERTENAPMSIYPVALKNVNGNLPHKIHV
jgi:hypothetical protein